MSSKIVVWFRQDLRLADNPALYEATQKGTVIPVYILEDEDAGDYKSGGAARWWLNHSLTSLNDTLEGKLNIYYGKAAEIIPRLVKASSASGVFWNRCYEPWRLQRDARIKETLRADNIRVGSFNGSLLWEPWKVLKEDGTPYRVFTPYYQKGCLKAMPPAQPLPMPETLNLSDRVYSDMTVKDLPLLPDILWHLKLEPHWNISEYAATQALQKFVTYGLTDYKKGRDYPDRAFVSRLSPYLHHGEISPRTVWYTAMKAGTGNNLFHFLSELGWREFSYYLLYHFPFLPERNMQEKFNRFAWENDPVKIRAWQQGKTGIPIVDAGMRELWQTGYMHNRVRMIVGSFLVKNLLIHWHHGRDWFLDCLADADLANNSAGWQWIAGCGADAAPYFRIFNPVTQSEKFDPEGAYIHRYLPELANLKPPHLFSPWDAPAEKLMSAGVILGKTYPHPIVSLSESREKALKTFSLLKAPEANETGAHNRATT